MTSDQPSQSRRRMRMGDVKVSEKHEMWDLSGRVATQCNVDERPSHSKLLGPDGKPLKYKQHPVGFDLLPRENK